ncbi:hypothetical protein [Oxalobacter paraformigenes]|nr:hypothetical protein [Oxalobacter paraformigenes]
MNTAPQLANCRKILLTLFVLRLPVRYVAGNHGFAGSKTSCPSPVLPHLSHPREVTMYTL